MSYTALYRKFRPATFDEVKGQDHIVKTLKNQLKADRLGHAYLFYGTRGTGKTSVAKIFAKAVNCAHPEDGNPCNACASCRAIAEGSAMNVIEMDAASNNGVDTIREIREEVAYPPADGRYKVYIIDEAHMLTPSACNALLKTLEEPPAYVIFILATTDIHPIPVTILSRCQRYDFRRLSQETILSQLKELTEKEQIQAQEKALRYIARKADGSMRDALSLLDQCSSYYLGEELTYDRVLDALGAVDTDVFSDLLRKILRGEISEAIRRLDQLLMQGYDLTQFVNDFTWYMRNLMLLKASDDMEDLLDVSSENLVQLKEEAAMIRSDTLMRYIRIFSELSSEIRHESNKRIAVEMALIRLSRPEMERDELSLLERIRKLERTAEQQALQIKDGTADRTGETAADPVRQDCGNETGAKDTPAKEAAAKEAAAKETEIKKAAAAEEGEQETKDALRARVAPEDLQKVCEQWNGIIRGAHGLFRTVLSSATPKFNLDDETDPKLYVVFADFLGEPYLDDAGRKAELEQMIASQTGKQIEVVFVLGADEKIQRNRLAKIEVQKRLKEMVNMEIEEED